MSANIGVKTPHREYVANAPKWKKIRDVLASDCRSYLRDVGSSEPDQEYGAQRQKDYADGAVLYNFVKRTLSGMVGAVMRKPPEATFPTALQYLLTNCNGAGLGIIQQAQDTLREDDSLGRTGLLVDAPPVAAATKAEQNAGMLNPRILMYTAENIINWRHETLGSTQVLKFIVLREAYEYTSGIDEFSVLIGEQYRVLEVVEGRYRQRLFRFDSTGSLTGEIEVIKVNPPRNTIPFVFIGSDNNDAAIDPSPLETLVDLNIGHYRNSADVEESSFICSQPTLMIYPSLAWTQANHDKYNPNGVRLGSRSGHLFAEGRSELLQAQESNLAKTLMLDKENQAVMAGAQLLTPTAQITAESARIQRGADTSIMSTIAGNVSTAYEQAIKWCAEMMGATGEIVFELNQEFFLQPMTAQDRAAWMADINAGLLPRRAYQAALRSSGVTNWSDEEIEDELERQTPPPAPTMDASVTVDIPEAPPEQQAQQ
jgi:hypothetical protein